MGIKECWEKAPRFFITQSKTEFFNIGLHLPVSAGALIAPGEKHSLHKTIGDVTALPEYKQAY